MRRPAARDLGPNALQLRVVDRIGRALARFDQFPVLFAISDDAP